MKKVYCEDDRLIIPDFINKMTDEELDAFIVKKEKELRERKQERERKLAVAQ